MQSDLQRLSLICSKGVCNLHPRNMHCNMTTEHEQQLNIECTRQTAEFGRIFDRMRLGMTSFTNLWTKWNPKAAIKKSFRERLTKVNVILGCFVHFSRCRRYHNMVWDILLVAMSNICDRQFAQSTRISRDHLYHKRRHTSPSLSFACIRIKAIFGIQQTLHSNDGNNNSRSLSFSMGMHFFCVCNW